ncbi:MAG: selenocysteine-specific translation elongation factor [Candidatus Zixiibacteriota bacterium]
MLIIGTAGHIDHGKSSIVRILTGTDPDRLPEEKARGMTIDLGFAFYRTADEDTIAFVDVPGHERFVKNMVAGVGAIDAVMLVIAADDGWMPQSEEHFQIVRLLAVHRGLVVLNKIDLVDAEWLQLLEQDIAGKVKDSFLHKAPIFKVSAHTGEGFGELRTYLDKLPAEHASQKDIGKARLYIDRSFVRPGIGGVVTGTLRGGKLTMGQTVTIWPSMKQAKIRSLHSNNSDVNVAVPGQRTAVSFTGLDKENLVRGGVVIDHAEPDYFRRHQVLALSLESLKTAPVEIEDRRRVLVIVGTTEAEGELRLYDRKKLGPGESGLVFFKPDEPVYSLIGDHFILRLPTPMVTIGGGQVLDHLEHFPRKRHAERYEYLSSRIPLTARTLLVSELKKQTLVPTDALLINSDYSAEEIERELKNLWQARTVKLHEGYVYHEADFKKSLERFQKLIEDHLKEHSHIKGLTVEQVSRLTGLDSARSHVMIKLLISSGEMIQLGELYNLVGRGMALKGAARLAHDDIMAMMKREPYAPPSLAILADRGKAYKDAIKFMLDTGQGYKCGADFVFLTEVWEELVTFIRGTLNSSGKLNVTDMRERFGLTRKYLIPVLEETDRIKLTRREGDIRVKGDKFEG